MFDSEEAAGIVAAALMKRKRLTDVAAERLDYRAYRESQYDKLAEKLRENLDMEEIYKILEKGAQDGKAED